MIVDIKIYWYVWALILTLTCKEIRGDGSREVGIGLLMVFYKQQVTVGPWVSEIMLTMKNKCHFWHSMKKILNSDLALGAHAQLVEDIACTAEKNSRRPLIFLHQHLARGKRKGGVRSTCLWQIKKCYSCYSALNSWEKLEKKYLRKIKSNDCQTGTRYAITAEREKKLQEKHSQEKRK